MHTLITHAASRLWPILVVLIMGQIFGNVNADFPDKPHPLPQPMQIIILNQGENPRLDVCNNTHWQNWTFEVIPYKGWEAPVDAALTMSFVGPHAVAVNIDFGFPKGRTDPNYDQQAWIGEYCVTMQGLNEFYGDWWHPEKVEATWRYRDGTEVVQVLYPIYGTPGPAVPYFTSDSGGD